MNVAIHQPNFIPWSGYFYKMYLSDNFIFLDDVQYSKNSYINRVNILYDSKSSWLTIPVKYKFGEEINKVSISDYDWKTKHLSKILNAYLKTKYFSEIYKKIQSIYTDISTNNLSDINQIIIRGISELLGLERKFFKSSDLQINSNLKGDEKLIQILKVFNAKVYYSGEGGKKYMSPEKFAEAGITLKYTAYKEKFYYQNSTSFINGLSIIDLLFHLGIKDTINYIKS